MKVQSLRIKSLRDNILADNVIFLHDENYGNYASETCDYIKLECIIAKQRQGQRDIFSVLKFYPNVQKFYD